MEGVQIYGLVNWVIPTWRHSIFSCKFSFYLSVYADWCWTIIFCSGWMWPVLPEENRSCLAGIISALLCCPTRPETATAGSYIRLPQRGKTKLSAAESALGALLKTAGANFPSKVQVTEPRSHLCQTLATLVVPFWLCLLLTPSSLPLLATMVQHAQIKLLGKGTEETVLGVETTWKQERWKCYIDLSDKNIWHAAQWWWGSAFVFQIFTHLHQAASLVLPELWGTSYSHLNDPK